MDKKYEQIIDLPHHVSDKHKPMSLSDRAAQFSPFAALTGYDDSVSEAARYTEDRKSQDDDKKRLLSEQISAISETRGNDTEITVRYFVKDKTKEGGRYEETTGIVRRVDEFSRNLIFVDGKKIPIDDISDIYGVFFDNLS